MQFIGSFSTFDPLSGYFSFPYSELRKSNLAFVEISDEKPAFPLILDWIAGRARLLLPNRNIEQISNALNTINYLLNEAIVKNLSPTTSEDKWEIAATTNVNDIPLELYTPARLLQSQIAGFSVEGDELFPNARWQEYFAVLALAALGDIHRFMREKLDVGAVGLAAEAMEALTFAESKALFGPILTEAVEQKISLRNRNSAIEKHAKVNQWKEWFWDWVKREHLPALKGPLNKQAAARAYKAEFMDHVIEAGQAPELANVKEIVRMLASSLTNNPRFPNL